MIKFRIEIYSFQNIYSLKKNNENLVIFFELMESIENGKVDGILVGG